MGETIEIPVWLLVLAAVLAAVAILDRIFMPSIRWYLRRRLARAVERLNDRLQLRIQPFKLTRRKIMIDRLIHDPAVVEAINIHAEDQDMPRELAARQAAKYAREIVPSFSAFAYFGFGTRISRFLSQALYRVRVGFMDDEALRGVDPDAAVVFVMNHRSNMDYVLVTYLAAERSALSYAVGEWARVWPLQQLIRSMGAYFIRRKSRNALYRRVLARYVRMATEGGVTQAIFPEGGLSLSGRIGSPKLGLLSYILSDYAPETARDVVFVPVGLNYDRVLEDRVLTAVKVGADRRFKFQLGTAAGFLARHIWLRISGQFYKFGYACVSFGEPLSLKTFLHDTKAANPDDATENLGTELMARVGRVVPVLPVSMVSKIMLEEGKPMTQLAVKAQCHAMWKRLSKAGAYSHVPRGDEDYAVDVGLRMLQSRHLIKEDDGLISIDPESTALIEYYANAISHLTDATAP